MKRRSMKHVRKDIKPFKSLAVATIAGLSIIGVGQAQATTIDDIDITQQPIDTPTLDYLHDNNVQMTDENGQEIGTYPQSGYTMTSVSANPDGSKPDGGNIITKYEVKNVTRYYDKTTGAPVETPVAGVEYKVVEEKELVPMFYAIDLEQTEYGNKDATNQEIKYYSWAKNSDGNNILSQGSESSHDITYYIDKDKSSAERITTNQNGADINANFIEKSVSGSYSYGGAIYNNSGTIGNITGDFIDNFSEQGGGAIYNEWNSKIDNITGSFIGNHTQWAGGAIYNYGTIGSITGNFIDNYAEDGAGAIFNHGTIGSIAGNFIGNHAKSDSNSYYYGGAILNNENSVIDRINANFIGNYSFSDSVYACGGAISNQSNYMGNCPKIGDITGDFIGNYAVGDGAAAGGAIYNHASTIENTTGDFINNYVQSQNGGAHGGAIDNYCNWDNTIWNITGDFIGNYAVGYSGAYGGAISDSVGTIGDLTGDFINNYAQTQNRSAFGGAISFSNYSTIGNITGNFISNYAQTQNGNASGGAISISNDGGTIGDLTGDFINNYAQTQNGSAFGGAISFSKYSTIGNLTGSFINNYVKSETGTVRGGAIYSYIDLNIVADSNTSVFKGNYTESNGIKDDNAIYMDDNATLNFKMKNGGKIYMADNIDGTVTKDGNGNITNTYNVNISGDDVNNSTFYMLNDIRNANVTFDNTTINAVNNSTHVYDFNSLTLKNDTNFVADVDLANAEMDRIEANTYGSHQGNLNVVGMNLLSDATQDVTEIYFAEQGLKDNVVNGMPSIDGNNLPSTAQTTFYTPIYKYNAIYDNRDDGGYFMFAKGDKILTPNGNGGTTVTPSGNPSDAFNPAVLAPSVASQAGANATMNQTFNYAFQNSDNFMTIPYLERVSMKNANRYALSPTGDATDVGTFSPLFNAQHESFSAWVKPYASFENIPLKNGPKVSNITYGTLVGFDTPIKSIKHGWDRTWTGYIGYNGASQRYSGVDATQNGGLIGGTLTLYKGNFFNATTVSTGAIVGDSRTMYGTDNYTMLMAGVGNKTGYNIEFKEGKLIIQPSMLLSYTFVNTFDYTNAAGVRMKNDPLHAIQIAPGVKFIANTKNGWQPYIGVNMIWNLLDKSKVSANDVRLPEMSIKPYIQYGVGIQKRFKDRYMAFGQAMIQNGGRNGISLTAGFRWAVGKEGKPLEKVQSVNNKVSNINSMNGAKVLSINNTSIQSQPERKIIKQLSSEQRERIAKQYQNTTKTTSVGILKQF